MGARRAGPRSEVYPKPKHWLWAEGIGAVEREDFMALVLKCQVLENSVQSVGDGRDVRWCTKISQKAMGNRMKSARQHQEMLQIPGKVPKKAQTCSSEEHDPGNSSDRNYFTRENTPKTFLVPLPRPSNSPLRQAHDHEEISKLQIIPAETGDIFAVLRIPYKKEQILQQNLEFFKKIIEFSSKILEFYRIFWRKILELCIVFADV